MPNNMKVTRDDTETYEQVIEPMLTKLGNVCRAFEIPFVGIFQPATNRDEADVIRGQTFTPKHTAIHIAAAAYLLASEDPSDLSERIMKLAAYVMTKEIASSNKPHPLADLFAQMSESDDTGDKTLN
jgi:hypothetical protein